MRKTLITSKACVLVDQFTSAGGNVRFSIRKTVTENVNNVAGVLSMLLCVLVSEIVVILMSRSESEMR